MSWPTNDLSADDFESQTDSPATARGMLARLVSRVQSIITARGRPNGVCDLDSAGRVPAARRGTGLANGLVPLGSNGRVPAGILSGLLLTSAERAKLAGIEAGARADQTGAEIRGLLDRTLGGNAWRTLAAAGITRVTVTHRTDPPLSGRQAYGAYVTGLALDASISGSTLNLRLVRYRSIHSTGGAPGGGGGPN